MNKKTEKNIEEDIDVDIEDIKKTVYFITNITQLQGNRPMPGAISSKADYMGGIFDRWINTVPESVIFNKMLLPKISGKKEVKIITDYYDYSPKDVNIAPDVIGISVDKKAIPFIRFEKNQWVAIPKTPQIEVKTFKKSHTMISLRKHNYEYLVLIETNFRVDYLVPLIDKKFYSEKIYNELYMDNDVFIKSDPDKMIAQPRKIDLSDNNIGKIRLLGITTEKDFMKIATKYEAGVSVEYCSSICENQNKKPIKDSLGKLKEYCYLDENGLYKFSDKWNFYRESYKNNKNTKTLDFYVNDIDAIELLKINKDKIIIKALKNCIWGKDSLEAGKIYDINLKRLNRGASTDEEYFLLKDLLPKVKKQDDRLLNELKKIIDNN